MTRRILSGFCDPTRDDQGVRVFVIALALCAAVVAAVVAIVLAVDLVDARDMGDGLPDAP